MSYRFGREARIADWAPQSRCTLDQFHNDSHLTRNGPFKEANRRSRVERLHRVADALQRHLDV